MKAQKKEAGKQLLVWYYTERETFITNIIMGYESWVLYYDPVPTSNILQRILAQFFTLCNEDRVETSSWKLMSLFWDIKGVVYWEFMPSRTTINSDQYCVTTENLKQGIKRVRLLQKTVLLQYDNVRPHARVKTRACLTAFGLEVLIHLPYSLDLASN